VLPHFGTEAPKAHCRCGHAIAGRRGPETSGAVSPTAGGSPTGGSHGVSVAAAEFRCGNKGGGRHDGSIVWSDMGPVISRVHGETLLVN